MPSDAKKKRAATKKEAAKRKDLPKKKETETDGDGEVNGIANGDTKNGVAVNGVGKVASDMPRGSIAFLEEKMHEMDICAEYRSCTGVLMSHQDSRDLRLSKTTIRFYGVELLQETDLILNVGRRYGLIGTNGCGKSSLLSALARREFDIPQHLDIFHLRYEMPPSTKTALQAVMEVDQERKRLEIEADALSLRDDEVSHERLMDVLERLESMEAEKAQMKAGSILHGLGFTKEMQAKQVKDFSGGWRMRIALARALHISPSILLLDEPTNHLDLEACVWLEETLKKYKRILVMISHSQDFMNGVCTNIIHFHEKKLTYYSGNYDQYMKTRFELEENKMKKHKWEQDQIAHMKDYIARFGHGSAKRARQAQSKQKTLNRMVEGGLTDKVSSDKNLAFCFYECGTIPPPVVMVQHVSFQYTETTPWIYRDLDFGVDLDTRLALVGPNGAGKSTLLKLIAGELIPSDGLIRRHSHLKIGRYHQHLAESMDITMSALDWMMKTFPEVKEREEMRKIVGRYGLTGQQQTVPIKNLSDGQRCRVVFAWLAWQRPHLLLMDEPTNHLDIETIDSLADAINDFEGGLILVSHDFRLISQVAEEIWICEHGKVTKWDDDIFEYKRKLGKKIIKELAAEDTQK